MNIQWEDGGLVFGDLDEFLTELLRRLPECAATDDEPARKRMFGRPTGGKDPEADEEWQEVVQPELRELFQSHVDAVSADLAGLTQEDGVGLLRVPPEHARAWVHTLNQARLALAARHDVTEADMEGRQAVEEEDKAFALFQIEIYGLILGFLLRHVEL
jgi:hypothetical protein